MRLKFSRQDIDFVLDHYQELRVGIDPDPQCVESGGRSRSRYHAPGLMLMEMAGEIAARVKLCGLDGMLVEERYGMKSGEPMTEAEIEKARHIPLYEVLRRISRVRWYCTGRGRGIKKQPGGGYRFEAYEDWKRRTQQYHHYRIANFRLAGTINIQNT